MKKELKTTSQIFKVAPDFNTFFDDKFNKIDKSSNQLFSQNSSIISISDKNRSRNYGNQKNQKSNFLKFVNFQNNSIQDDSEVSDCEDLLNLSYELPKFKKIKYKTNQLKEKNEKLLIYNFSNMINKLKNSLIGIENVNDYEIIINFIKRKLQNKNENFENYFQNENSYIKNSFFGLKFNLINCIKIENEKNSFEKTKIINLVKEKYNNKPFIYNKYQRKRAIRKYVSKKSNRKSPKFIRYKVRQELAENRGRHRGKFIKRKRVDLKKAHKEFLKEKENKTKIKKNSFTSSQIN